MDQQDDTGEKHYMISELKDTSKAEALFDGWEETLIYSCLQNVMGKVFFIDLSLP